MSDARDPLQDSLERPLPEQMYPSNKRIVFGSRRVTEEAFGLSGIPWLIEAPFPTERTLHWNPCAAAEDFDTVDLAVVNGEENPEPDASVLSETPVKHSPDEVPTPPPIEISGQTSVVVSQEVLLKVNEHVSQSLERELGGFLLGNRYRCPNTLRDYVIIDQYSQAKFTESTEINLAFTHEAWAQLADELSGKFLGKLLIGWYHSHPRMDVFLSSHDMEIQTERFGEPWMVALVLEPEKHRGGFFCARDGRVKPNSPVDFFELLERNSRDSVMAWKNYAAVDRSTSSAPVLSATNTASPANGVTPETLGKSQENRRIEAKKPRRRGRLFGWILIGLLVAAAGAGALNRKRVANWWKNRNAGAVPVQQPSPPPAQPSATQAEANAAAGATATPTPTPSPEPTPSPAVSPELTTPLKVEQGDTNRKLNLARSVKAQAEKQARINQARKRNRRSRT
jgi:proteasome lid subunit RPN8/RPN11